MITPRIYVASLAAYNAGKLHGAWISVDKHTDADVLSEEISEMLAKCPTPGEEWAVHDHEGFYSINIGEHPDLEAVATHAKMIREHGFAWSAYVSHVGEDYATPEEFQDCYRGFYSSPEDYAEELISDCFDTKAVGPLANYIDYEAYARDLDLGGDVSFIEDKDRGGVHVFDNH